MKGRRIPGAKRDLVLALRRAGLSLRDIAQAVGLARSSVSRICLKELPELSDRRRPLGKCPRCGRLVRLPCLSCYLEMAPENRKRAWRDEFLSLEIRAEKEAEGDQSFASGH
jgi:transcriptional regulator with XRE-family HTH domain